MDKMDKNFMKINNKIVQLSQPYKAPVTELVGRNQEIRKILAAWMGTNSGIYMSPLLQSPPGCGKNRIAYEVARLCSKDLYIFQGHEDVSAEDLVCAVRFSDNPERKMDYLVSPIVTAMLRGGVCFIDEIAKIRPRALAPLASLLDDRRYIDSILLGERIYAHPGFRFTAATNTTDLERNMLPDFISSRLRPVITVGNSPREEIARIIRARFPVLQNNGTALLDHFWKSWRDKNGDKPPTPRDSIYIFGYALNSADFRTIEGQHPYSLEKCGDSPGIQEEDIEQAFSAFYDSSFGGA
ncbi:MAG: AAA family ATPase [Deltaproteobacteria bacterium]|nr:AAA family ATPase [Deltaproteobacteria bacterium]